MKNSLRTIKMTTILLLTIFGLNAQAQFSGDFDVSNWTFVPNTLDGDGSINVSYAPDSIILSGSDSENMYQTNYEDFTITIPYNGLISFDFNHYNEDIDYASYIINGNSTELIQQSGTGSVDSIAVAIGDVFGFRVNSQDNCCGRGVLTVSNFGFIYLNPVIVLEPADVTICEESNTFFAVEAKGAIAYRWQVNTGSDFVDLTDVSPYAGSSTDTLTITDATIGMQNYIYRCIVTGNEAPEDTSTAATLTVIQIPVAEIEDNGSELKSIHVATSYQWIDCNDNNLPIDGEVLQQYSLTSSGAYAVILNQLGCIDTSACYTVTLTDMASHMANTSLSISPNPTAGMLTIANSAHVQVELVNVLGEVVYSFYTTQNENTIDISHLSNGAYFVKVMQENENVQIFKVVKQ